MTDLMTIEQTALLLAKVQLIDNREVSKLVIREWHDILAEQITFDQAVGAVKRFRQERPGVYLEPGHLLEMAGETPAVSAWPDRTDEVLEQLMRRDLASLGTTPELYRSDPATRARVDAALDARAIEAADRA